MTLNFESSWLHYQGTVLADMDTTPMCSVNSNCEPESFWTNSWPLKQYRKMQPVLFHFTEEEGEAQGHCDPASDDRQACLSSCLPPTVPHWDSSSWFQRPQAPELPDTCHLLLARRPVIVVGVTPACTSITFLHCLLSSYLGNSAVR